MGGGIHYLRNLGDIDESGIDLDKNSIGIIGSLMAKAERLLREACCPKINLQVRAGNAAVVGFYRQL